MLKYLVGCSFLFGLITTAYSDTLTIPNKYVARDFTKAWLICNAPQSLWPESKRINATHLSVGTNIWTLPAPGIPEVGQPTSVVNDNGETWTLTFTYLPHLQIDAPNGIVDEPKTATSFTFCSPNGDSTGGWMGVEFRGATSQLYPKKSLDVELWTSSTGDQSWDHSFLDMRSDDDWHFFALYNEPARFNNYVGHKLWRSIARVPYSDAEPEVVLGIDQKYIEVFLNGSYHGIYLLTEQLDRKQLKLKKHNGSVRGYMVKGVDNDYGTWMVNPLWCCDNSSEYWLGFERMYPDEVIDWQPMYEHINYLVNSQSPILWNDRDAHFNMANSIDWFIHVNALYALDNTSKNVIWARYDAGHPFFLVAWDLDGIMGTNWNGEWINETNGILSNPFFDKMKQDCRVGGWVDQMLQRYNELKMQGFINDSVVSWIESAHELLRSNGAYARESVVWGCDPNYLDAHREWLQRRLSYLDEHLPLLCPSLIDAKNTMTIIPNPSSTQAELRWLGYLPMDVRIMNNLGQTIGGLRVEGETTPLPELPTGIYHLVTEEEYPKSVKWVVLRPTP